MRTTKIIPNIYRDSIALMDLSAQVSALPGVSTATAVMATQVNIDLLQEAGLLIEKMSARPNDILIFVEGVDNTAITAAVQAAESALAAAPAAAIATGVAPALIPSSLQMALEDSRDANLALISTPGEYAAAEAEKALRLGLDTMVFSANVPVDDEIRLKRIAREQGLLLMGPDCGTAIVGGIPLGFANALRRGPVGAVASAGTGLQEVTCLLDRAGVGISHALGSGGRDLSEAIGGASMLQGLAMLAADPSTEIIALIAKHPSALAARRVLDAATKVAKPVVVAFLGIESRHSGTNIHVAETLEDTANRVVQLLSGTPPRTSAGSSAGPADIQRHAAALTRSQKYVRGVFSGGTFCYEAQLVLAKDLGSVWSNVPVNPKNAMTDVWKSRQHALIDMGDDVFTRGRPHPMIDFRLRLQRLAQEARDPETAVILFDVVLGYGANANPAQGIAEAIAAFRKDAAGNSPPAFVASVCGTTRDPQNLELQESTLQAAGVLLAPSNAAAARVAGALARLQIRQAASQ